MIIKFIISILLLSDVILHTTAAVSDDMTFDDFFIQFMPANVHETRDDASQYNDTNDYSIEHMSIIPIPPPAVAIIKEWYNFTNSMRRFLNDTIDLIESNISDDYHQINVYRNATSVVEEINEFLDRFNETVDRNDTSNQIWVSNTTNVTNQLYALQMKLYSYAIHLKAILTHLNDSAEHVTRVKPKVILDDGIDSLSDWAKKRIQMANEYIATITQMRNKYPDFLHWDALKSIKRSMISYERFLSAEFRIAFTKYIITNETAKERLNSLVNVKDPKDFENVHVMLIYYKIVDQLSVNITLKPMKIAFRDDDPDLIAFAKGTEHSGNWWHKAMDSIKSMSVGWEIVACFVITLFMFAFCAFIFQFCNLFRHQLFFE